MALAASAAAVVDGDNNNTTDNRSNSNSNNNNRLASCPSCDCILYLHLICTPSLKETTNGVCGVMHRGVTNKMVAVVAPVVVSNIIV